MRDFYYTGCTRNERHTSSGIPGYIRKKLKKNTQVNRTADLTGEILGQTHTELAKLITL